MAAAPVDEPIIQLPVDSEATSTADRVHEDTTKTEEIEHASNTEESSVETQSTDMVQLSKSREAPGKQLSPEINGKGDLEIENSINDNSDKTDRDETTGVMDSVTEREQNEDSPDLNNIPEDQGTVNDESNNDTGLDAPETEQVEQIDRHSGYGDTHEGPLTDTQVSAAPSSPNNGNSQDEHVDTPESDVVHSETDVQVTTDNADNVSEGNMEMEGDNITQGVSDDTAQEVTDDVEQETPGDTPQETPGDRPQVTPGDEPQVTPGDEPQVTSDDTPHVVPEETGSQTSNADDEQMRTEDTPALDTPTAMSEVEPDGSSSANDYHVHEETGVPSPTDVQEDPPIDDNEVQDQGDSTKTGEEASHVATDDTMKDDNSNQVLAVSDAESSDVTEQVSSAVHVVSDDASDKQVSDSVTAEETTPLESTVDDDKSNTEVPSTENSSTEAATDNISADVTAQDGGSMETAEDTETTNNSGNQTVVTETGETAGTMATITEGGTGSEDVVMTDTDAMETSSSLEPQGSQDAGESMMPKIVAGSVTSMPCILEGSVTSYSQDITDPASEQPLGSSIDTETGNKESGNQQVEDVTAMEVNPPATVQSEGVSPMEVDEPTTANETQSKTEDKTLSDTGKDDEKPKTHEDDDLIVVGEADKSKPVEIIDLIDDDDASPVKEKIPDTKKSESQSGEKAASQADNVDKVAESDTTGNASQSNQLNINQTRSRNISNIISKIVQQKQTTEDEKSHSNEQGKEKAETTIKIKNEPEEPKKGDTKVSFSTATSIATSTRSNTAAKTSQTPSTKSTTEEDDDPDLEITQVIRTSRRPQPSCIQCKAVKTLTQTLDWNRQRYRFCSLACMDNFAKKNSLRIDKTQSQNSQPATKTCGYCKGVVNSSNHGKFIKNLSGRVLMFCSQACLTEINRRMKTCINCNKELISNSDIIMAQVANKGPFKEFCSQDCVSNYEAKRTDKPKNDGVVKKCSVCDKMGQVKHEVNFQGQVHKLCSDACFAAFRYAHNLSMNCCDQCGVNCYNDKFTPQYMQYEGKPKRFCTLRCMNKFKDLHKRYVECFWCKTQKTNFEMVERVDSNNKVQLFCSLPCLQAYREKVSSQPTPAVVPQTQKAATSVSQVQLPQKASTSVTANSALCHHCKKMSPPLFHLTMSDNTIRNFCCYNCVIAFQAQFNTPTVTLPHQTLQLQCSHCKMNFSTKPITLEYKGNCTQFCSQPCLEDFKRINAITAVCDMCQQEKILYETCKFSGQDRSFCSEGCKLLFKQDFAKGLGLKCIVCDYCSQVGRALCDKVFDGKKKQFCSLACRDKYELWYSQAARCDGCRQQGRRLEESFMWRGEMKHVCNQHCLLLFYTQQNVPNLTTQMQPKLPDTTSTTGLNTLAGASSTPIIASVMSLAPGQQQNQVVFQQQPVVSSISKATVPGIQINTTRSLAPKTNQIKIQNIQGSATKVHQVSLPSIHGTALAKTATEAITQTSGKTGVQPPLPKLDPPPLAPPPPKILKNKSLMCKPFTQTKATSCKPHQSTKSTNTDLDWKPKLVVVPIPVPIYVPVPMQMYSSVVPAPVITPLPVPVPMWLPVANSDAEKLIKTMEEIKEKVPSDPLEAELLLMAEAIAGEDKKNEESKPKSSAASETHDDGETGGNLTFEETEQVIPSQMLEDDILQMAANIAQVISEPSNDQDFSAVFHNSLETPELTNIDFEEELLSPREQRARARSKPTPRNTRSSRRRGRGRKRTRVVDREEEEEIDEASPATPQQNQSQGFKYTYGINAYRIWAQQKNQENADDRRAYKFKSDVLQCSADEINYSLFHFLKEVRKPSGEEYTPDTIFYLCLGIQQYLFENGRVENIFTDIYFEKFTDILTEILSRWKPDINHIGMINTCIEEEMLWECKQLGAHSPFVLLSTLVYFNTKYFHMKTTDEHCQMSFTHVLKHWKKGTSKNQAKSVYLRYYNAQGKGQEPGNKRKRDDTPMLEQSENTANPLRCPVKLYEFYLSKCPESVRSRSDVFYLVPEKSCVPDSPVWYSNIPVGDHLMNKMLTRNIMVKEVHEQWESFAMEEDY